MLAAHRWGYGALWVIIALAGCGPSTARGAQGGGHTTGSIATESTTTGPGRMSASSTSATGSDVPGTSFADFPDGGPIVKTCYFVGCPEAHKCAPIGTADGGWITEVCVPVVPDPKHLGEPCTVEDSPLSGSDDCDVDTLCWDVDLDTLEGTCAPFHDLVCEGQAMPLSGVWLCLDLSACDPLVQDCAEGSGCYVVQTGLFCLPRYFTSVAQGQRCSELTMCEPGFTCQRETLSGDCDLAHCCTPYCSLSSTVCEDPEQHCVPLPLNNPAENLQDFGYCGLRPS